MTNPLTALWDRAFNRWETTILERGTAVWTRQDPFTGWTIPGSEHQREFVVYKDTHRYRKAERIRKVYLN